MIIAVDNVMIKDSVMGVETRIYQVNIALLQREMEKLKQAQLKETLRRGTVITLSEFLRYRLRDVIGE